MDKFMVLILLLAINLFSVISHQLKFKREATNQDKYNDNIVINEKIPFYYLEYSHGKFMKTDRYFGLYARTATAQNYNNKTNHLGKYFLNLLLIPDYDIYKKIGPMGFEEHQMELWSNVDKYFQKLIDPQIKIVISAIAFPTREGIFDGPSVIDGKNYYKSNDTLDKMSKWLKDNEENFEDLKYDAFVYTTSWPLKHYDDGRQRYVNDNYMTSPFVCDYKNNKKSNATRPPSGIFYYSTDRSTFGINNIYGTHFIAEGFGVSFDQDVGCKGGYVMDNWDRNYDSSWSECSLSSFQKIKRNSSYSCLKWTLESIRAEQDYDD